MPDMRAAVSPPPPKQIGFALLGHAVNVTNLLYVPRNDLFLPSVLTLPGL